LGGEKSSGGGDRGAGRLADEREEGEGVVRAQVRRMNQRHTSWQRTYGRAREDLGLGFACRRRNYRVRD